MPLYEYYCPDCTITFDTLRPAAQADEAIICPKCEEKRPQRILSLFAAPAKNGQMPIMQAAVPSSAAGMGGGCCGGSCGCHH